MIRLIIKILKDETGFWPAVGVMAGSSILGGLFGKNKTKTYDPYSDLRGDWKNWMSSKLGTSTPYKYNPDFELTQPDVEGALEGGILGGLNKGSNRFQSDIFNTMQKYQEARSGSLQSKQERDIEANNEAYNRLGLVSSTPGLEANADIRSDYGDKQRELDAEIAMQGIGLELESTKLAEDIYNNYMSQAQVLGGAQRGYQQYSQQMSMQDIIRKVEEEMGYGQMAGGVLGNNPPQAWQEPNIWSQIGQTGQDIGSIMLLSSILGGGGGGTTAGGGSSPAIQDLLNNRYSGVGNNPYRLTGLLG